MSVRDLFREGDWLGDYEIRGRLRAGGMATLFLAQRHGAAGVSRPVVIKVIHPHLAQDESIVRMFIDEARISSNISHSNVVYVEKFGEHDGVYYIVMEYVDGCSLHQLLHACKAEGRTVPAAVAVHLASEVAAGLHAAHVTAGDDGAPLGIVHRDVSPSNVLVTRDGRVKVIDFGIAKARGRLGGTRSGSGLKGKLRYMAPEQAWGRPIDRRTDVYALGVCLWELLTCRQLFRAKDDLAALELVRNPVVPPPSKLNPEVSPALDAVVLRATARRPEDRQQTALELRRELMAAEPGAVAVPPETVAEIVHHVCAPNRAATVENATATLEDITESSSVVTGSSFGSVVGEVRPRTWRNRGLVFAGIVGACAIGVVIAVSRSEDTGRAAVPAPSRTGAAVAADPISAPPAATPPAVVPVRPADPASMSAASAAVAGGNGGAANGGAANAGASNAGASSAGVPSAAATTAGATSAGAPTAAAANAGAPSAGATSAAASTAAATPSATRPGPRRPPRAAPADDSHVTSVEADGAVLADEPTPAAGKPAAKPTPPTAKPAPRSAAKAAGAAPKAANAVRADDAVLAR